MIECVPNFSEGRRQPVIDAIAEVITSVPQVRLLDVSSDADHNRTVMTFVAPSEYIGEAAFRGIAKAAALIDLSTHAGVHPRIGAADVVPFVPLGEESMQTCVQIARDLGHRVGETLRLPVYLYEQAAFLPERANLAAVRRDKYEMLKTTIQTDQSRRPDFGPCEIGAAGAVAIGARDFLIAFNAYLDTDDVRVAQAIARRIRAAGGGLPHLKAIGLLVNGQAQVSMNVVDFRQTSLFTVLTGVCAEAAKHQAIITHTELVGLIPQDALLQSALQYLQLPPETLDSILERRLQENL